MEFGRNRRGGGAKGRGAKPSAPPHAPQKVSSTFHQSFIIFMFKFITPFWGKTSRKQRVL